MKTAYINARMHNTNHDAFIVENSIFTHVGRKRQILEKPIDAIIDLKDHAVLPGFHDAHLHLLGLGKMMAMIDVEDVGSINELIERLKDKKGPVIIGRGYAEEQFKEKRTPTKADLDKVSDSVPVLLYRFCSHVMIANQAAIDLAYKLNKAYPEAENQYNLSTGWFSESSREWLMTLESDTQQAMRQFILNAQAQLIKHGITAVGSDDFGVVSCDYEAVLEVFKTLGESGELKLRVLEQVNIPDAKRFQDFLDKGYPHKTYGRFKIGPVKLLLDGSLGARTAAMRAPYTDAPEEKGMLVYTEAFIHDRLNRARAAGMDYAMHAIGDRTIETLIRVSAEREETEYRDAIIHAQLADHEQIERMHALKLGAQIQPAFIGSDAPIVYDRLGDRADNTYLFNTMLDLGLKTAFSTDAPIESVNPFHTLYTAITRKKINHPAAPYNLAEGVSFNRALEAYTKTPAYFSRDEKTLGSLKKHYKADFIVVKHLDYHDVNTLKDARVLETYIGGECVHSTRTHK